MKSKQRQEMADLAKKRFDRLKENQQEREELHAHQRTGQENLRLILGMPGDSAQREVEPEPEKPQIILYLKDGLNAAGRNFTKYPNEIHDSIKERLKEKSEALLYIYLWRQSWGYNRNYCRISHGAISKGSLVGSRRTVQRAMDVLAEKHFVVRALQETGDPNITQRGHLYRIITPEELTSGKTEEGVELDIIPLEGVVMMTIAAVTTPGNADKQRDSEGVDMMTIRHGGYSHGVHSHDGYTGMDTMTIATMTTPEQNTDDSKLGVRYGHDDYSHDDTPLKEDSLKDTLSLDHIINLFYTGIGQSRISNEKRESAKRIFQELKADGFSAEDIRFAVEWILKPGNAKEKPYDFSIIQHTIGQSQKAQEAAQKAQMVKAESKSIQEQENRLQAKIDVLRANMSDVELADLRKQAEDEIRNTEEIKEQFVSEPLITAKENEILRRKH